jgi:hypothetical protein
MIEDGEMSPTRCQVFSEDLLYVFYGRPAYRRAEFEQLRTSARAPIVVVLSPEAENQGVRMFPFDTGAFPERYAKVRHSSMSVSDFELPCQASASQRHIAEFFGSNSSYLALKGQMPSRSFHGEFEVEFISELVAERSNEPADDRRLAIELQLNRTIPFASPMIAALVVPDLLLDSGWFQTWMATGGQHVHIETYEFEPLRVAAHYQVALESCARQLVESAT